MMVTKVEAVVVTLVEAALCDSFHSFKRVEVTVVVSSATTIVNVLNLSRTIVCHL